MNEEKINKEKIDIDLFSEEEEKKLLDKFYVDQLKYHNDPKLADHNLKCFKEELERIKKTFYKEIAFCLTNKMELMFNGL